MAAMTGTLLLKMESQLFETEQGSIEIELGGEVVKGKPSPATGGVNTYTEMTLGRATQTLHATKKTDIEFLRRFRESEVVFTCRDTGKQWQSIMSTSESVKLQDNGRGIPLVLEGTPFIQTSG